ncbi:MAG: M23 family metallopeptidase [Myxococcota bacterium]
MVGRTNDPPLRRPAALLLALLALLALFVALLTSDRVAAQARTTPPAWTCRDELCQRATRQGDRLAIELQNRGPRSTWVVLEPFDLSNVKTLRPAPFTLRIGPGETRTAGVLAIQDETQPYAYQARWRALPGNPDAVHDDRWQYRMPFGGPSPAEISQGYDGPFTHKGLAAYALDIPLPLGTPVLAARGGTIVEVPTDPVASGVAERRSESEMDRRVMIEHADGTFGIYAHLRPGGPARLGQHVEAGDPIGFSGDTGFATGPHLHFEVAKFRRDGQRQTLPVRFWNGTAQGFVPLAGFAYAPGCSRADGARCRPGELASEPPPPSSPSFPAAPDGPER